jgi:hypothetical protein
MRELARALRAPPSANGLAEAFSPLGQWPTVNRLTDFEALRCRQAGEYTLDGGALARMGTRFHDSAGTLTQGVSENLARISAGTSCVRVSHQPNFAAYLKQLALFITADAVAGHLDLPPVYVINDCDVIANERFARCMLPDVTREKGYEYVALPPKRKPHDSVAFRVPPPPAHWLAELTKRLRDNVRDERRLIRIEPPEDALSIEEVVEDLEHALAVAQSLSEFTSVLLSRIVNLRLDLPIPFLPGHELWKEVGASALGDMLARWPEVSAAQATVASRLSVVAGLDFNWDWLRDTELAPVWWLCDCDRRIRLRLTDGATIAGRCGDCELDVSLASEECATEVARGRLLPRVGLLDLTESAVKTLDSGVSYMSSGAHSLIYGLVGEELGMAPLAQIFLDVRGRFGTPIERLFDSTWRPKAALGLDASAELVREGRATGIYYLTRLGRGDFGAALRRWIINGNFDDTVSL